jgi:hypothetical protein
MPMFRRLLAASLMACLVGCNNSVSPLPTSPSQSAQLPSTYVVSGTVTRHLGRA